MRWLIGGKKKTTLLEEKNLFSLLRVYEQVVFLNRFHNWASEASPTLGCSIEISRDIYMYVHESVVVQKA